VVLAHTRMERLTFIEASLYFAEGVIHNIMLILTYSLREVFRGPFSILRNPKA